jgi:hypothetical protein
MNCLQMFSINITSSEVPSVATMRVVNSDMTWVRIRASRSTREFYCSIPCPKIYCAGRLDAMSTNIIKTAILSFNEAALERGEGLQLLCILISLFGMRGCDPKHRGLRMHWRRFAARSETGRDDLRSYDLLGYRS